MTHMVRLYHRLTAVGARWGRHGRTAVRLWTQVAIYPAYAAFQGIRLGLRRLQGLMVTGRQRLHLGAQAAVDAEVPGGTARAWPGDWPRDWGIQRLLAALVPLGSSALALPSAPGALTPGTADLDAALGTFDLGALQLGDQILPRNVSIGGIASQLSDRTLVLVGTDNRLWDVLSVPQQAAIADAIAYLMASYGYALRQWRQRQLAAGPLPLPEAHRYTWWPLRQGVRLMHWMQASPVAIATNLFHEAEGWGQRAAPWQGAPDGPNGPDKIPTSTWFWPSRRRLESGTAGTPIEADPQPRRVSDVPWPDQWTGDIVGGWGEGWPDTQVETLAVATAPTLAGSPGGRDDWAVASVPIGTGDPGGETWVEVAVASVQYVDHPLGMLLRWLDQGLLWWERQGQRLWQWVRSQIQSEP